MKTNLLTLAGMAACLMASCLPALAVPVVTPEPSTSLLVAGAGGALLILRMLRKKK